MDPTVYSTQGIFSVHDHHVHCEDTPISDLCRDLLLVLTYYYYISKYPPAADICPESVSHLNDTLVVPKKVANNSFISSSLKTCAWLFPPAALHMHSVLILRAQQQGLNCN